MATRIVPREEMEKQNYYMQCVRDFNFGRGEAPTACIKTFGCQMNEHDSEKIAGMLERMGYQLVPDEIEGKYENRICDLIVFNTCCIRENAEEKVFGHIGALKGAKRTKPEMITVVCGCMTEQQHIVDEINRKYKNVDVVFGTHNLYRLPEFLYHALFDGRRVCELSHTEGEVSEGLPVKRDSAYKAWVTIMYGCNNFCTYCIVPYVRGRERSRRKSDILREIEELAASGVREITLLGQNGAQPVFFAQDSGIAQAVAALVTVQRRFDGHPAGGKDAVAVAQVEILAARVAGHAVVAVARQTQQLCVTVKADRFRSLSHNF